MIAYFDLVAGASGDMLLAALLDAGADEAYVRKQLHSVSGSIDLTRETVTKKGLRADSVLISGEISAATYPQVMALIDEADLDDHVQLQARRILLRLFQAEAEVHGVEIEHVHLHELSAADTIGDIVGVSAALHSSAIEEVVASQVPLGGGTVQTQHGILPVPVPAVLSILRGVPTRTSTIAAELVTPTGAAILAEVVDTFGEIPAMTIGRVGVGAGTRDLDIPNIVRVILGERVELPASLVTDALIEANVDDLNPEIYQYAIERLFSAGAVDVWIVPAIGRHGRPLSVLSVLAPLPLVASIREVLVKETSTIGVRVTEISRSMLERRWDEVRVEGHVIRVKVALEASSVVNVAPEYVDCAEVARRTAIPLKEVFRSALAEWSKVRRTDDLSQVD